MSYQYDEWFVQNLISLIQAIQGQKDINDIKPIMDEIQNGLTYVSSNPNGINPLLVRMAEGLIGPVIRTYKLDSKQEPMKKDDINLDELKNALGEHQKNKIINKMSGSLKSLEEFE